MRNRDFDARSSEWLGDMVVWLQENANDNSELLTRLFQNLRRARQQDLTARQRQVLALYYDQGMTMPQIAGQLGVNCSTVSRTIRRAKRRLYRSLRYSL
ncbi:sigma-70 family RNA polymerase sigma factor [Oscillibacter sp.]|uniref:sigma-70 family RNA polymerase sigma factor n=1 Tax=Oscillibacter sp. TaxID=1945593 RepID=UPI0026374652|nr:sigma-70 family RNA polymerase sigma factor [Oscillibacter sp.]MDD3346396.1 sigma-70 family RNA polymerase sigma factor [Oscillibacter sp.]